MAKVTVVDRDEVFEVSAGESLLDALRGKGAAPHSPCNGKGTCGKCRMRVVAGEQLSASEEEVRLLGEDAVSKGWRLACMHQVAGDIAVALEDAAADARILVEGEMPSFEKDLYDAGCFGLAVDIGTTTVVCSLVDLFSGELIESASSVNGQVLFGADVLSRITYEVEHPQTGIGDLRGAITGTLDSLVSEVCARAGIDSGSIDNVVVSANCTMNHMLMGVDATSIGRAPYEPVFTGLRSCPAAKLGLKTLPNAQLACLPSVSAYVGGDIVSGALACQLNEAQDTVLFVDIGTNGEIVLAHGGRLLCCACAAGPALEGMNITCGMRAAEGAIEELSIDEDGLHLQTIGDASPRGLCGSGVLAVLRELLGAQLIRSNGTFVKLESLAEDDYRRGLLRLDGKKRQFVLADGDAPLLVTQGDVRQIQLAKGAIRAGIVALVEAAGLELSDIDRVMIAGQFGAHVSVESLTGTGLIPAEFVDRISYVGNSSRTGAYMALMSEDARSRMEQLAEEMEYLELSDSARYQDLFVKCMTFEEASR